MSTFPSTQSLIGIEEWRPESKSGERRFHDFLQRLGFRAIDRIRLLSGQPARQDCCPRQAAPGARKGTSL